MSVRQITVDFEAIPKMDDPFLGYIGEHNATELVITPPAEMTDNTDIANYCVAFNVESALIHSSVLPLTSGKLYCKLWKQITVDNTLGIQVEGYSSDNALIAKSDMIYGFLAPSSEGTNTTADTTNASLVSQVSALQTAVTGKEDKTNKVTSVASTSTDTEYPSAKAVYTAINNARESELCIIHLDHNATTSTRTYYKVNTDGTETLITDLYTLMTAEIAKGHVPLIAKTQSGVAVYPAVYWLYLGKINYSGSAETPSFVEINSSGTGYTIHTFSPVNWGYLEATSYSFPSSASFNSLTLSVNAIASKIPSSASSSNKLVTATQLSGKFSNPTNNDSATVGQILSKTSSGSQWIDNTSSVTSVNGETGAVVLESDDIKYDTSESSTKTIKDKFTDVADALDTKLDSPSNSGTTGQVLTKTADGSSWADATGTVTDVTVGGTSVVSSGVAVIPSIPSVSSVTVTLTASGWSGNAQTVSVSGVTTSNIVVVSPSSTSYLAYGEAEVRATAQGSGTLTFGCESTPSVDLTINVIIIGA